MTKLTSDLPIFQRREDILSAVDSNQVTIVTAETGAGKSTQVPQYLLEHGYKKVIVTQPRILAARNLTRRVREEWAERTLEDSSEIIGYRTAHERDDSPDTKILYCTDGLQLVREITGIGVSEQQVLVLDEVHEWNVNMEVLVAWAKLRCQEDPRFKVVVMSATLEADRLSKYFDGAAVISVKGRSFPVTKNRGADVVAEILNKLEANHNTLVFLPGKTEIEAVSEIIAPKAKEMGVPVIPLHAQLELEQQQRAFQRYENGKVILSTNIAQTSVTIGDIDVVIDSGLERRSEIRNGVEGLFIGQTSQADCLQRAGRAGRTKPGEYVLAPLDDMPCLEFDERDPYPVPEIMRTLLDRLTLRLANVGLDIERLDFYHSPSKRAMHNAKRKLIALGALSYAGEVTNMGRQMEQFPVESSYARMLVEVQKYDREVQAKLAAIIGIQEVDGIVKSGTRFSGWRKYTKQTDSDLLAQYDVYMALPTIDELQYEELGIIAKNIDKAEEVIERLRRDLNLQDAPLSSLREEDTEPLLRSIVAGQVDQLWAIDDSGEAVHLLNKKRRKLSSASVVYGARLVTGTPFDLQIPSQKGGFETLRLVQGVTRVNPKWLQTLAPGQFTAKSGKIYFDSRRGSLAMRQYMRFKKQIIEGESMPILEPTARNRKLLAELYAEYIHRRLENERKTLRRGKTYRVSLPPVRHLQKHIAAVLGDAMSFDQLSKQQRVELERIGELRTYIGDEQYEQLAPRRSHRQKHYKHEKRRHKRRH